MHLDLRTIPVRFPNRRSVLAGSRADGPRMTVFVPSDADVHTGELVRLEISVVGLERAFVIAGRVGSMAGVRIGLVREPGFEVNVEALWKREAAAMVALCAGRPAWMGTSAAERFSADLRCTVRQGRHRVRGRIADLSAGGVFVAAEDTSVLSIGTDVKLVVEPGLFGIGGTPVGARVIWRGRKRGKTGYGVRFTDRGARVKSLLEKYGH